jgi:hypothetical protein
LLGLRAGGDEDRSAQDWTAWLMSQAFGAWLIGLVGIVIIGTGVAIAIKGWNAKFERRLTVDHNVRPWAVAVGQIGLIARGMVFLLIGGFLTAAAIRNDPSEAKGLSGALRALQEQPYGDALIIVAGVGLIAFGVYGFVQAVYRRIEAARVEQTVSRIASAS